MSLRIDRALWVLLTIAGALWSAPAAAQCASGQVPCGSSHCMPAGSVCCSSIGREDLYCGSGYLCTQCSSGVSCTTSGTCSGGSDSCSSYGSCGSCTAVAGCGWCGGSCRSGTSSGPDIGSCSEWDWYSSHCSGSGGGYDTPGNFGGLATACSSSGAGPSLLLASLVGLLLLRKRRRSGRALIAAAGIAALGCGGTEFDANGNWAVPGQAKEISAKGDGTGEKTIDGPAIDPALPDLKPNECTPMQPVQAEPGEARR